MSLVLAILLVVVLWGLFIGAALEQIDNDVIPAALHMVLMAIAFVASIPVVAVMRAGEIIGAAINDAVNP